jgi:spore germination protein PF
MPSVIGGINIQSNSGISNFGDAFYLSPKSSSKTNSGSGSSNTSNFLMTNNGINATGVVDPDVADQNIVANA